MKMEGSVDEESTKSDEEYDDLAMQDIQENGYFTGLQDHQENGYFTDAELEYKQDTSTSTRADKYKQNLERFLRTKRESVTDSLVVNSGIPKEKRLPSSGSLRVRGRSYSISGAKKEQLSPPVSRTSSSVTGGILRRPVSSGSRS